MGALGFFSTEMVWSHLSPFPFVYWHIPSLQVFIQSLYLVCWAKGHINFFFPLLFFPPLVSVLKDVKLDD